ncbi:hypothetical protein CH273_13515 [Rhodococcus sp. 05-339-2]|nr:hypothetical protein CH273_13515 [Rhodococcus sp. 05-339-2]
MARASLLRVQSRVRTFLRLGNSDFATGRDVEDGCSAIQDSDVDTSVDILLKGEVSCKLLNATIG